METKIKALEVVYGKRKNYVDIVDANVYYVVEIRGKRFSCKCQVTVMVDVDKHDEESLLQSMRMQLNYIQKKYCDAGEIVDVEQILKPAIERMQEIINKIRKREPVNELF